MLELFIILYLAITLMIGFFANRYVKNSKDFVQAGRNLPMFFNATALFALWFGSETVFGASSEFATHGLIGVIEDPFGGVLCLLLFALFFVRRLYRLNLLTLGDLFRNQYGKRVEMISSAFMLITFFGYIAAQLVALALILKSVTGLPQEYGVLICSIIVTSYTFVGGMWAVSITDFLQSIFIVIGLSAFAIFLTAEAGGFEAVFAASEPSTFQFFPEGNGVEITNWIAAWLTLGLGSLASQDIFQRVNSAKSEKAAVRSTYLGAFLYLVFAMFPLYIVLAAKAIYPELSDMAASEEGFDAQQVIPTMVLNHAPLFIQVLIFGSLISAVLSTCSGALLAPASILSENLIKPAVKKEYTDKQFLWLVRLSVVLIAIVATVMATIRQDIYELVAESSILGIVSLLVPMVFALFFKKIASTSGAMLSMFLGISSWIILEYFIQPEINAFIPALFISILAMISGYYFEKLKGKKIKL